MILAGSEDEVLPSRVQKEMSRLFPRAEFREVIGVGHSIYFEDPEGFNRIIDDFISKSR
jgi:pimeloyl-ACP methyl ester carboxylesterase